MLSNSSCPVEGSYQLSRPERPPAGIEAPWVQFTIPSAICEDRVEEIYEDLCYVKFTSSVPEVAIDFLNYLLTPLRLHTALFFSE